MRGRRRNSPRDRRMHGPSAAGASQYSLHSLGRPHLAELGLYGGILAPYAANDNIARLAAEGCVLDNAFCTNSISVPSRAAILTGQYSHLNGVYTLDDALRPEQDNIAKRLQQAGYRTALVGK